MRGIFDVDGKFFQVTSKIVDLVLLSLLWLIGCLPIVTIVTSTSSMYHTVVKCIRFDRGSCWGDFREAYKKNLKQGIGLTLLFGGVGAVIGFLDYQIFVVSQNRSSLFFALAFGMLLVSFVYLLNVLWIIPVFSRFSNTFGNILKLNYVIAVRHIPRSLLLFALMAAVVILLLASNELIFIAPALVCLVSSYAFENALHKFMPEQNEDNGDWRYGFR